MSLVEQIRDIQQSAHAETSTEHAWKHNERIIQILKNMGMYQVPAPKTYLTEGYISPPNHVEILSPEVATQLLCWKQS